MTTFHYDPAHPIIIPDPDSHLDYSVGLTKREYFAALAMQALLARSTDAKLYRTDARDAVMWADELINALNTP